MGSKRKPSRPEIITLCGSSRFVSQMAVLAWILERDQGAIVLGLHLLPQWYSVDIPPDHLAEKEGVNEAMDELHLRKIDLADKILVVNITGYIGESTRREIAYAEANKKQIEYLEGSRLEDTLHSIIARYLQDTNRL